MAGRREEKKSRTRHQLVAAATRVFARRGYAAATLDDIAAEAGLTKGAVYSNFEGKTDLAIAVLDRRIDQPLTIFARVSPTASPAEQLRLGGSLLADELDAAMAWFVLELECTAAAADNPELAARLRARDAVMRDALVAALTDRFETLGSPRPATDVMAGALIAAVNGIALQRLKDPGVLPAEAISRVIAAVQGAFLPA